MEIRITLRPEPTPEAIPSPEAAHGAGVATIEIREDGRVFSEILGTEVEENPGYHYRDRPYYAPYEGDITISVQAVRSSSEDCCGYCRDSFDGVTDCKVCPSCGLRVHHDCHIELSEENWRSHAIGCRNACENFVTQLVHQHQEQGKRTNGDVVALLISGKNLQEIAELTENLGRKAYYNGRVKAKRWYEIQDQVTNALDRARGFGKYYGKANPGSARMSLGLMIRGLVKTLGCTGLNQIQAIISEVSTRREG